MSSGEQLAASTPEEYLDQLCAWLKALLALNVDLTPSREPQRVDSFLL